MANVVFSGGSAGGGGFDMGWWAPSSVMGLITTVYSSSHSSTHVTYTDGVTTLTIYGNFTSFDEFNDPSAGTVTSFVYTTQFTPGVPATVTLTGISVSVPNFIDWTFSGNTTAFDNAVLGSADTMSGTNYNDTIHGYGGGDTINANDGNDTVSGGDGNDTLNGGDGNDTLDYNGGSQGNDIISGGDGDDFIGSSGVDQIDGGAGFDVLSIAISIAGDVNVSTAGMSTDAGVTLQNGATVRNVEAVSVSTGAGNDTLTLTSLPPTPLTGPPLGFRAGGGTDTLIADFSSATIAISLFPSAEFLIGHFNGFQLESVERYNFTTGSGNDELRGAALNDTFSSGAGNDTLDGKDGNDTLNGGDGNDTITGGAGVDIINGGDGDDTVTDGSGGDQVDGGAGNDSLYLAYGIDYSSNVIFSISGLASGLTLADGTHFQNFEQVSLYTGAGNDVLDATGATGSGTGFHAGGGTDRLIIDLSSDVGGISLQWAVSAIVANNLYLATSSVEEFYVTGGSGVDDLNGGEGGDRFLGGGSVDYLDGRGGNDHIEGGDGNDSIQGGSGVNALFGDGGDDSIISRGVGDTIDGGDGDDYVAIVRTDSAVNFNINTGALLSSSWATLADGSMVRNVERFAISSGSGNDTFTVSAISGSSNSIGGGAGTDRVIADFSAGSSALLFVGYSEDSRSLTIDGNVIGFGEIEQFHISGGSAGDRIDGASGNDVINGNDGADSLDSGGGVNIVNGGAGNDVITSRGIDAVDGGDGVDFSGIFRWTSALNFTFDTALMSSAGGQTLVDGSVIRNIEQFNIQGGNGNDTAIFSGALAGSNVFYGYGGTNTLILDASSQSSMINTSFLQIYGAGFSLEYSGVHFLTIRGGSANDTLIGLSNVDTFYGNAGDDALHGGDGNDFLYGGDGNDDLNGGEGADRMEGGAGDDLYRINLPGDQVIEAVDAGVDTVITNINNHTLRDNFENLLLGSGIANGGGNALNNIITGNSGANTLWGGSGDDVLDGQGGADTFDGGAGNDTYYIDLPGDAVWEAADAGTDTVVTSLNNYTLRNNFENITLAGSTANGGGNALNNVVIGNAAVNVLWGGAGNDILNGMGGADQFDGGAGDDTYIIDVAADAVWEAASAGADTVLSSVNNYSLRNNFENLTLDGATPNGGGNSLNNVIIGNAAANIIWGNAGNDTLNGMDGADQLDGGAGDDTYYLGVGDYVWEGVGAGTDTIITSVNNYSLRNNFENITLADGIANGGGNTLNNIVTGNALNNVLWGKEGDDSLFGNGGADQFDGGAGNDNYYVDSADDIVFEAASAGHDTLLTTVSRTLGNNFEDLVLLWTGGAINGTGNGLNNEIEGNDYANVINGAGGDDVIMGYRGSDALTGGAGNDAFVFAVGAGGFATDATITDFAAGGADDSLDLSAYNGSGVTWSVSQAGADAVFDFSNGDQITLTNVNSGDLIYDGLFGYS